MTSTRMLIYALVSFSLVFISCTAQQVGSTTTPDIPMPVETFTSTPASVSTDQPVRQPTMLATSNGSIIYDDTKNIVSVNPDTGETQVLISRDELKFILGEDKSGESYTYGYEKPIKIDLSPDLKKAYVSICASLDNRLRCIFEDYIYTLEDKSAIKLPMPPDTYGVYWKWSPDGTKLAGAAWTYVAAAYQLTRFYSVGSDGAALQSIDSVNNGRWQIVWHPGSKVILPMTFITNFQLLYADGSKQEDIPIEGLEWDDRIECLAFSPDAAQAAFIIRRDLPRDHDWLYVTRSNFTGLSLLTEYDIDSRYNCNIGWSPDQSFIHIGYESDSRAETGQADTNGTLPPMDKVVNVQTGSPVETPENTHICGWSPDGNLLYENKSFAGVEGGVDLLDPVSAEQPVSLPAGMGDVVQHCPIQWLKEDPGLNIPVGLPSPNACHPGEARTDEDESAASTLPPVFDITEASSSLSGETLTAVFTMREVTKDLAQYATPGVTNFFNGWDVLIDIDNNLLTGDQYGTEYRFSVAVRPESAGTPAAMGSALLQYDPTVSGSYLKKGNVQIELSEDDKTLTLIGDIPGVTSDSRIIFLSRVMNNATNSVIGDHLCN